MSSVVIHTDGACSGNPGPGGWGAVLQYGDTVKELKGGAPLTTNNQMELTAAIEALTALKGEQPSKRATELCDGVQGANRCVSTVLVELVGAQAMYRDAGGLEVLRQ